MSMQSLLTLALAVGTSASVLPRASANNGFLSLPIAHETRAIEPKLLRRDDQVTLYNHSAIAYMIELHVGTPPQTVRVQLDTGSDELWLDPDCSAISNDVSAQYCTTLGLYDPTQSSTVVDQGVEKQLSYGIGTAKVHYVSDHISIPGTSNQVLQDVIFGVATASKDAAVPIMGIGFGNGVNLDYNNIVDELAAQGVTATKAFSLALGPSTATDGGVVVFGGVDTKKFKGPLHRYANLPPQGSESSWRYWIQLDGVGLSRAGSPGTQYPGSQLPIVLDSGSSYSYLPSALLKKLMADLGGQVADSDGTIQVPCSLLSQGGSVDFTFGDLTIQVPFTEFIRELATDVCILGAMPGDDVAILGDTFLRSVYVVFDQTNKQIFLAPYANCGSSEQSLPAGAGAAGNFTGQCTGSPNAASSRNIGAALMGLVGLQILMAFL